MQYMPGWAVKMNAQSQSATSLLGHLRVKHPVEIAEAERKQTEEKQNQLHQVSLNEADIWAGKWSFNTEKAIVVHKHVFYTILTDLQPMSVVEDEGFHRLIHATWLKYEIPGCKFFSEKLPSDGLPVSLVASSAFKDYVHALDPWYVLATCQCISQRLKPSTKRNQRWRSRPT